ncbi:KDEL motif-containing protein 1 [Morella rubra]|uniref:KDEL motif-containing protein 1 n=1 Tax=Morella rubra TaxID=262757 RepID=A0A6A1UY40_9ROSI|nr:KDEL motif-containing protein 1 [Morella rubra]
MKRNDEKRVNNFWNGQALLKHFNGSRWLYVKKRAATASVIFFSFFLLVSVLISVGWIDAVSLAFITYTFKLGFLVSVTKLAASLRKSTSVRWPCPRATKRPQKQEFTLRCTQGNLTKTCPKDYPTKHEHTHPDRPISSNATCPSYFRWIHEDLRHWKDTGITSAMVERARRTAHFRLVIVDGKAYVERYKKSLQTRDVFTLWGLLQLLRWYPGRLPDLDMMFDCDDRPVFRSKDFRGPNAGPPPLFRYCSDAWSMDIVFPDWSFWGWAETNIRPWGSMLERLKEGNKRTKWEDRVPYAYWRGNPYVTPTRGDLMKCNASDKADWNTRLYIQDWMQESKKGYNHSNLEDQCTHRFKIYAEGWAWSVSEKYILACDSMTMFIRSRFYDFFIRGMVPLQHYWPIRDNSKCTSLKFAVEWGNNHTQEAQAIGKAASNFIQEDLKMEFVYDYMFHLLNEYAKLLKFKPSIPPTASELCSELMACPANGTWKNYMVESLVKSPSDSTPCIMPPPYDPSEFRVLFDTAGRSIKQVEQWENEYWQKLNKKQ